MTTAGRTRRIRFGTRLAMPLTAACLVFGCGEDVRHAPQSAESIEQWEGVGIWRHDGDSAPLDRVQGIVEDTAAGFVRTGGLVWRVEGVERLNKGIAGAWPDVDDRWIAVRVRLDYERDPGDTATPWQPRTVRLRQSLVLVDERGGRHVANLVHDRLVPPIDQPLVVPETGLTVPVVFAVGLGTQAMALEVHDPLGSGIIRWHEAVGPGDWQPVRSQGFLEDEAGRALWEVMLVETRREGAGRPGDTVGPLFSAHIQLRNVSSAAAPAPDPAAARLYLGSGRTLSAVSLSQRRLIAPGQATLLTASFVGVPMREALTLVLDFGDRVLPLDAAPGLLPERVSTMGEAVSSEGVRVSLYGVRRTESGGIEIRLGMMNNGARPLVTPGIAVEGRGADGIAVIPAAMRDAPERLYPGYEERRWVECAAAPSSLVIQIPGRPVIRLPIS